MHNKRWYDIDPTISLSISLLRSSSQNIQEDCASYIIDFAKQNNVTLNTTSLNDTFNFILRRWYDQNKLISEALEYYEHAPFEIQKELALEVIKKLQQSL